MSRLSISNLPLAAGLLARLSGRLDDFLAAPGLCMAVEFAAGRLTVTRAAAAGGGPSGLRAALRRLEAGAVLPSAVQPNLLDPEAVAAQLRPLLEALGGLENDVMLLVPDLTARVSVLEFDTLPARRDEIEPLVRFRLRKSLPFAEDKAVISSQILNPAATGVPARMLVALADRARLDEYENCLEAAGARAAVVLPSGLTCLAAHAALDHGALLVRAEPGSLTTAFCWQGRVEFFRVVELEMEATFDDVFPSVAFFRDRWERQAGSEAALASPGSLVLMASGVTPDLAQRLREEIPWAAVREAEVQAELVNGDAGGNLSEGLLATAGALRGRFS